MKKYTLVAEYTTTCFTHVEAGSLSEAIKLATKRDIIGHPKDGLGDGNIGWATERGSIPEDASIRPSDLIDCHNVTISEFHEALDSFIDS